MKIPWMKGIIMEQLNRDLQWWPTLWETLARKASGRKTEEQVQALCLWIRTVFL